MTGHPHEPPPLAAGAPNLRDLGGYRTRDGRRVALGRVFRSDQLNFLAPEEVGQIEALGVRTVVDLRLGIERAAEPSPPLRGARAVVADVLAGAEFDAEGMPPGTWERVRAGDAAGVMCDLYRALVELPTALHGYRALVAAVIEADGATLFHCTAGQDRTGWGAAVLLSLVGVAREDVFSDYLLSARRLAVKHERLLAADAARLAPLGVHADQMAPLYWAREDYLAAAFEHARRVYGSFDTYAEDALGVDEASRQRLRARLLEP